MAHYAGEIRMVSFKYAPKDWLICDGQQVSVYNYPHLFAAIGSRYGGDGKPFFNVPDLRGRTVLHAGKGEGLDNNYALNTFTGYPFSVLQDEKLIPAESATHINPPAAGFTNLQPAIAVNFIISCKTDY